MIFIFYVFGQKTDAKMSGLDAAPAPESFAAFLCPAYGREGDGYNTRKGKKSTRR